MKSSKNQYSTVCNIMMYSKISLLIVFTFVSFSFQLYSQNLPAPCTDWGKDCSSWAPLTKVANIDYIIMPGNSPMTCSLRVYSAKRTCNGIDQVIITGIETVDNTHLGINDATFTNIIEQIIKGAYDSSKDFFDLVPTQSSSNDEIYLSPCWKIITNICASPPSFRRMILPCSEFACCRMSFQRSSCDVKEGCIDSKNYECQEPPYSIDISSPGLLPYSATYYPNFPYIFSQLCSTPITAVERDCSTPLRLYCSDLHYIFQCPNNNPR